MAGLFGVNDREVVSLTAPTGFGAATFDQGDVTDFLSQGRLPASVAVRDSFEHASGAFAYALNLAPGQARDVFVLVPLAGRSPAPPAEGAAVWVARQLGRVPRVMAREARSRRDLAPRHGGREHAEEPARVDPDQP
jgi:hypothetical protein